MTDTAKTETFHAGGFIVEELPNFGSRAEVTLSNANGDTSKTFEAGTVLGVITGNNSDSLGAKGEYVQVNEDQNDGSQTYAGILYGECVLAAGATQKVAIVNRGPLDVRESDIVWPESASGGEKSSWRTAAAAHPFNTKFRASENDN